MVKKAKAKVEIIDAEIVEEITDPDLDFKDAKKSRKKPIGTRKKDFPEFTVGNREKVIQLASMGSPPNITAKSAGINPKTLENWLMKGEECSMKLEVGEELEPVEKDFVDFWVRFNQVTANAVVSLLAALRTQAQKNPHIALKLLEKLAPEEFGARQQVEMKGAVKHGHLHAIVGAGDLLPEGDEVAKKMTTEQLRKLRGHRLKQLAAGEVQEKDDDEEE